MHAKYTTSYQASISERLQKIREEQGCSLGEARRRLWQEQWGGAEGAGCSADAELMREEQLDLPPASDMTRSGVHTHTHIHIS
jgi:hypothetical protein